MKNLLSYLTLIDYIIIATYLLILIAIGYWVSFVKKKKENENLFLAERSLGWPSIGLNMWGTNVGPSMLLASASAGYTSGIVSGNFAWYAFIFILMLAVVFAPRYLGAKVSTLPEYMGKRFGQSTRYILAWYTLITILISWLSLGLFAGGIMVKQLLGIPMWESVIIMVVLASLLTAAGGLKAIAYTSVFQMILLIAVSLTLTLIGLSKVGGISVLYHQTPAHYWNLFQPINDKDFPWLPILLGYPIMGVWFWCTEQSMVQSVLGAKNLKHGQLGASFIGWLKILDVPLFIIPGVICFVLFPHIKADEAYLVMVTNLFPMGMKGLIIVVLLAALIGNIGSSLNSVSTVYTMDIYLKKHKPNATNAEIIKIGRYITFFSAIISVIVALAIDNIKGLNLFNIFQSVLGFLAPSMSVVFLFAVFWKKTSSKAVNIILTIGTLFSLTIAVMYWWIYPVEKYNFWPHFMLMSFYIFTILAIATFLISYFGKNAKDQNTLDSGNLPKPSKTVWISWIILIIVMIGLYLIFNGH
jgi:solute:Na+ symporter, SSS family